MRTCYLLNLKAKFGKSAKYFLNADKHSETWSAKGLLKSGKNGIMQDIFPIYYNSDKCKAWLEKEGILVSFEEAKKNRQLEQDGKMNFIAYLNYSTGHLFEKQEESFDSNKNTEPKLEELVLKPEYKWSKSSAPITGITK